MVRVNPPSPFLEKTTPRPRPPPAGGLTACCCLNLVFIGLLLGAAGERLLAHSVDPRNETLG